MGVGCNDRYAPLSVDVVWLCEVVVISLCVVDPLLMDVVVLVPRVGKAIPVLISLLLFLRALNWIGCALYMKRLRCR